MARTRGPKDLLSSKECDTLQREEKQPLTVGVSAKPQQSAPAANGARELECDDLCIKVGLALNQNVTTMQSKPGTGRGVVVPFKSRNQLK